MISLYPSHWGYVSHCRPSQTSQAEMDLNSSFELHTWMIARLVENSGPDTTSSLLSQYVIGVCYERMITRMTYRVSISFRDTLKDLPLTFEFPKQFPLSVIEASALNDSRFITSLLEFKIFLKLHTPIDNLVKHRNDLYNQETYVDFHLILCELLELLLMSLKDLKIFHNELAGKVLSSKQHDKTMEKINFIAIVGSILRLLVMSQAIKKCLYSIAGFLPDRAASIKAKVDNKTDRDDDDDNEQDKDDEEDRLYRDDDEEENEDELYVDSVGQGSESIKLGPTSLACLKSLNLAVVYFDAILVLSHFVKSQNSSLVEIEIDIKILLLPCRSKDMPMLPWRTLLQHETYFPGNPSPSAKEIVDFLELWVSSTSNLESSKKSRKSSKKSQKEPVSTEISPESVLARLAGLRGDIAHDLDKDTYTTKIDEAHDLLTMVHYDDDTTPGLRSHIACIISKLKSAKGLYPDKRDMRDEIDGIIDMLRTLADNTKLERMLRKGSPLDTGIGFKGRLHAEACVAAYCTSTNPEWFLPVSYFIIIFCSDLLILLVV